MTDKGSLLAIYDYTEKRINSAVESVAGINARLTAVIAGAGLLAKFASEVTCETVRICLCLCIIGCVISAVLGLTAKGAGELVSPRYLVDNLYYESEEKCRLQILSNWLVALDQINRVREMKALLLNYSYVFLVLSFLLFVDAIIACIN